MLELSAESQNIAELNKQALNLAVLYNQRRSKRNYYKRRLRSNDDRNEASMPELNAENLPFWDAYDVVNQLYLELGKSLLYF